MINADKPQNWKRDIQLSVDCYNRWFLEFAPKTYRQSREVAMGRVREAMEHAHDLTQITPGIIRQKPQIVQILRMCTVPPIARDRLVGLAEVNKSLVGSLEGGKVPPRLSDEALDAQLGRICATIQQMLDKDIFPWLDEGNRPDDEARERATTIVADRLTGANADPIVRNAQERRQLELIRQYLCSLGYTEQAPVPGSQPTAMVPGTFWFRLNVRAGVGDGVNIPIDAVIQPKRAKPGTMPILIEAKSAGDFTNVNKRRKEEAQKVRQLRERYGGDTSLVLFLCGYFDPGYLGYEAAEGLDWVWEHRIQDLNQLGI